MPEATYRKSARTQIADTASETQLLAPNSRRKQAVVTNDSSAVLYVGLGTATVTATDYTFRLAQYATVVIGDGYDGEIRGVWASDPNDGAARITELTL